jgi:flagellar hook-basal body complex protein FliE
MQTDLVSQAAGLLASGPPLSQPGLTGRGGEGRMPFGGVLQDAMANMNALEARASGLVEGLVEGQGVDIHAAMIATQKADLAFEMALAVRGKAVAAYQSLMGVQF